MNWLRQLRQVTCPHNVGLLRERDDDGTYWFKCMRCGYREQVTRRKYTPTPREAVTDLRSRRQG